MINKTQVARTLKEWSAANRKYAEELYKFNSTSRFVRWLKQLGAPRYPSYKSIRIYVSYEDVAVVELCCFGGTYLKCAIGNVGYKINLTDGDVSYMLGSRGSNVGKQYHNIFCNIINEVRDVIITENIKYLNI